MAEIWLLEPVNDGDKLGTFPSSCFEANIEGWGQSWEGTQGSVCRETLQGGHPRSLG